MTNSNLDNPYKGLPSKSFYRSSVSDRNMFNINGLWKPKFRFSPDMKIVSFGSCFAQHIGKALKSRGYNFYITEAAPSRFTEEQKKQFNYELFSCRTGNIYTTSLFLQWLNWAAQKEIPPAEVYEFEGRFYDLFRPNIEPKGFVSVEELRNSLGQTIRSFKAAIRDADVVVFTLGLTESWFCNEGGYEYPICPGTVAGEYDPERHKFKNQNYESVKHSLIKALEVMRELNPRSKLLLTVSPVPLAATYSNEHVLIATQYSKSVLRAVAGSLASEDSDIDYFPSFEIISSPPFRGTFYQPDQRHVTEQGVSHVMDNFFSAISDKYTANSESKDLRPVDKFVSLEDTGECEEELLAAFSPKGLL